MKTVSSPRTLLSALILMVSPASLHAQTLDWGNWSNSGTGVYDNGDTILISGVVNGSTTPANDENLSAHSIIDPAFPYANQPGAGEYGFFHNTTATASAWSVKIDLSNFTMTSDTVIGFSNLDGRDFNSLAPTTATILFLDANGNPVSIDSSTILGSYDTNWAWFNWTANSTFDRSTGIWGVVPDQGGFPPGTYFGGVSDAFFLKNLPTNIASILYTHNGGTGYVYDSTLFYAGNLAVPEPSALLLGGIAGIAGILRRRRIARGKAERDRAFFNAGSNNIMRNACHDVVCAPGGAWAAFLKTTCLKGFRALTNIVGPLGPHPAKGSRHAPGHCQNACLSSSNLTLSRGGRLVPCRW